MNLNVCPSLRLPSYRYKVLEMKIPLNTRFELGTSSFADRQANPLSQAGTPLFNRIIVAMFITSVKVRIIEMFDDECLMNVW